ncbi:unnamed protein product [Phytophthora fragariaefolia]|uniref:Unnamed protein product n=1 Tax=Phytophthora fragariaefolia TaxID=1490495 RepID=A0A9W7CJP4_9STRA|nr:unnamed protein product [Phytophthora fragariaefolia]
MRNMPVHEVEDELTRAMSKLRPVTAKAVKKCMKGIAIKIGIKLKRELETLLGLMCDGWTHAGMQYVALYGVYEADGEVHMRQLGLSPLTDGSQTTEAYVKMFKNVLEVYNKTLNMVGSLVGDNFKTNISIATKMGVPLEACASHRLNLAIKKYLASYETLLDEVNALMLELRHENNFGELKKHTDHPVKRNVTRWSSTFTMLERYIRIRPEIKKVEAVEERIPTVGKHRKLAALFEHLKKFESICKRRQHEDTDMAELRLILMASLQSILSWPTT